MHLFWRSLFFSILFLITFDSSARVAEHTDYRLPKAFFEHWYKISESGGQNPNASLDKALAEFSEIAKDDVYERAYADLVILSLYVKLQDSNAVSQKVSHLKPIIANFDTPLYTADLLLVEALNYKQMGKPDKALDVVNQSLVIAEELDIGKTIANIKAIKGHVLRAKGENVAALESFLTSYEYFKASGHKTQISATVSSIAQIYDATGEYETAIKYYKDSLAYLDPETQAYYVSIIHYNIASAYTRAEDFELAKQHFDLSIKLSEELEDKVGIAYVNASLGEIALKEYRYKSALSYFQSGFEVFEQSKDKQMLMNSHIGMAKSFKELGKVKDAIQHIEKGILLAKELDNKENDEVIYHVASKIYQAQGQFRQALEYYKIYAKTIEDIHLEEKQNQLDELKVKYDTEQKEARNLLLENQKQLAESALIKKDLQQRLMWLMLLLAALLIVSITYFLWRQISIRKRFAMLALTDELTGAPNRRNIMAYASEQFDIALSTESTLYIGILDLDYFKSVNDRFGHDVGDRVLRAFYDAVNSNILNKCKIGRLGGEEWLLVMPQFTKQDLEALFIAANKSLSKLNIPALPASHVITFSMGVSQVLGERDDLGALLKRADDAVYQAKHAGRNCWVIN